MIDESKGLNIISNPIYKDIEEKIDIVSCFSDNKATFELIEIETLFKIKYSNAGSKSLYIIFVRRIL